MTIDIIFRSNTQVGVIQFTDSDDPRAGFYFDEDGNRVLQYGPDALNSLGRHRIVSADDRFFFEFERYEYDRANDTFLHTWRWFVRAGTSFDHETESRIEFNIETLTVNGEHFNPPVIGQLVIAVPDINEQPQDISLNAAEGVTTSGDFNEIITLKPRSGDILIGTLTLFDPDSTDDVDGVDLDPDNHFGEYEFSLVGFTVNDPRSQRASDGIELREEGGEYKLYLTKSADELRHVDELFVSVWGIDNPGAHYKDRNRIEKSYTIKIDKDIDKDIDRALNIQVSNYDLSVDERGILAFGKFYDSAISIHGGEGRTFFGSILIDHGGIRLGYGYGKGRYFGEMTQEKINALLDGFVYRAFVSTDVDFLRISLNDGLGETLEFSLRITVNQIDDPLRIIGFGDRIIQRDNADHFSVLLDGGTLQDPSGDTLYNGEFFDPLPIGPQNGVTIEDDDGYTVVDGKLIVDVVHINYDTFDNKIDTRYDDRLEYITLRTSRPVGQTGLYLDSKDDDIKYSLGGPDSNDDLRIADIHKVADNSPKEDGKPKGDDNTARGGFTVIYTFTFKDNQSNSGKTDSEWETFQKDMLVDLINNLEVNGTGENVNPEYSFRNTRDFVTIRFEDGASGKQSDPVGVLVENYSNPSSEKLDDRLIDLARRLNVEDSTNILDIAEEERELFFFIDGDGITIKSKKIIQDDLIADLKNLERGTTPHALITWERVWEKKHTAADEEATNPITIRYYLPQTKAKLDTLLTDLSLKGRGNANIDSSLIATADMITAIEKAFMLIESSINIKFEKVTTFAADAVDLVAWGFSPPPPDPDSLVPNPPEVLGYANMRELLGSRVSYLGLSTSLSGAERNGTLLTTALHEIGHILGLAHPGLQQGFEDSPFVTWDEAIFSNTIEAYVHAIGLEALPPPTQLQQYDIATLQYLYGANTETNGGDTEYDYTELGAEDKLYGYVTIYDPSGIDTLNFDNPRFTNGLISLDLTPGVASSVFGNSHFIIAPGTGIENVIGTNHADMIRGNSLANRLEGRAGNDTLVGWRGNDTLIGGAGADDLDGGWGRDTAVYASSPTGVSVDLSRPNGLQEVTGIENDHASGDTLRGIENLIGSEHDDTLKGNGNENRLEGGAGDDTLTGGDGSDTFVVQFGIGKGWDIITDFQHSIDKLVLQVTEEFTSLAQYFRENYFVFVKTSPYEFRLVAYSDNDELVIQFTSSIADYDSFHEIFGLRENDDGFYHYTNMLEIELLPTDIV